VLLGLIAVERSRSSLRALGSREAAALDRLCAVSSAAYWCYRRSCGLSGGLASSASQSSNFPGQGQRQEGSDRGLLGFLSSCLPALLGVLSEGPVIAQPQQTQAQVQVQVSSTAALLRDVLPRVLRGLKQATDADLALLRVRLNQAITGSGAATGSGSEAEAFISSEDCGADVDSRDYQLGGLSSFVEFTTASTTTSASAG